MRPASALFLLSFLASITCFASLAQASGTLFGRALDAKTGLPLEGCRIRLLPGDTAAASDSAGRFRIGGLPAGTYRALFIKAGYEAAENSNVVVGPGMAEELVARLSPLDSTVALADLTARGKGREVRSRGNEGAGTFRYGRNDVLRAPGALGDISLFAQTLPGVTRTDDQATDLAVRGGGPDENAFLVDGIPIFNINHFENNNRAGGAIGNINTYFLEEVEFHTGAFSARYPDRLSSVMDIAFKRGNAARTSGMATADAAGLGGLLEGPIPGSGGRGTYGASMRVSALTFLDRVGLIDFGAVPRYGNAHLKVNQAVGGWEHSFNLLAGVDSYDALESEGTAPLRPGDSALYRSERMETLLTHNLFGGLRSTRNLPGARLSLYAAGNLRSYFHEEGLDRAYQGGTAGPFESARQREGEESGGERLLWGGDLDLFLSPRWTLRLGVLHEYDRPERETWNSLLAVRDGGDSSRDFRDDRSTSWYTAGGYAEALWANGPWDLAAGARIFYDEFSEDAFAGPRVSVRRRFGSHALKAAFGAHTQSQAAAAFGNALPPGSTRLPFNLQGVIGWDATWPLGLSTRVEAFQKQGFRLLRFRPDGTPRDTGTTVSRGVDVQAKKSLRGKAWGTAAYTFAWNREEREGAWRNHAYSVPHSFSTALGYDFSRRFTASLRMGLASGSPYTPLSPADSAGLRAAPDPASRFARATDAYFRLDARGEYRHAFRAATLGVFLEITNLTDRDNLFTRNEFFFEPGWGFLPIGGLTLSF